MADDEPFATSFSLAALATGEESYLATLQAIVDLVPAGVEGCHMAGITLLDRSGPTTAVATTSIAATVDAIQYTVNAGPCLDAYRRQVFNRVDDTETEERWPEFCRGALQAGVRSILSYPLIISGDGLGAMNVYGDSASSFTARSERAGAAFATHAAVTLANARAFWRADEVRRNLELALESRGVIDQAKGMLMARQGISADAAFDILRRASQRANRKISEMAKDVIDHGLGQVEGSVE
jgi:GAF domain-containing protein